MLNTYKRYVYINKNYMKVNRIALWILLLLTVAITIAVSVIFSKVYTSYNEKKLYYQLAKNNISCISCPIKEVDKKKLSKSTQKASSSEKYIKMFLKDQSKGNDKVEFISKCYFRIPITGTKKQYFAYKMDSNFAKYIKYDLLFGKWFNTNKEQNSYDSINEFQAIVSREMLFEYKLNHSYKITLWNGKKVNVRIIGILKNDFIFQKNSVDECNNGMLILDDKNQLNFPETIETYTADYVTYVSCQIKGSQKALKNFWKGRNREENDSTFYYNHQILKDELDTLKSLLELAISLFAIQIIGIFGYFVNLINKEKEKILIYKRVGAKDSDIRRIYLVDTIRFIALPEIITTAFIYLFGEIFSLERRFQFNIIMLVIILLELLISSLIISHKIKTINLTGKE